MIQKRKPASAFYISNKMASNELNLVNICVDAIPLCLDQII